MQSYRKQFFCSATLAFHDVALFVKTSNIDNWQGTKYAYTVVRLLIGKYMFKYQSKNKKQSSNLTMETPEQ